MISPDSSDRDYILQRWDSGKKRQKKLLTMSTPPRRTRARTPARPPPNAQDVEFGRLFRLAAAGNPEPPRASDPRITQKGSELRFSSWHHVIYLDMDSLICTRECNLIRKVRILAMARNSENPVLPPAVTCTSPRFIQQRTNRFSFLVGQLVTHAHRTLLSMADWWNYCPTESFMITCLRSIETTTNSQKSSIHHG